VSGDWRTDLRVARLARDPTPEQAAWDGHWRRWLDIARRSGRGYKAAVQVAYTRTEAQYGSRPVPVETPKETR
jgi:hypothetical protein